MTKEEMKTATDDQLEARWADLDVVWENCGSEKMKTLRGQVEAMIIGDERFHLRSEMRSRMEGGK